MKKKIVIERLDKTIKMLKSLKPQQFNFDSWVTDWEGKCGTVCCIAGWYPKYFPEAALMWDKDYECKIELYGKGKDRNNVINQLSKYHGLEEELIDAMFVGAGNNYEVTPKRRDVIYITYNIEYNTDKKVTIKLAIEMFETVKQLVQKGIIKHL